MVDWNSPTQLARDAQAFSNLLHVLSGIYLWEFCVSFPFDFSYFSGKRKFRWPLILYFTGRYCLLAAVISIICTLNVQSEVNCQALYVFTQTTANMAIGMASVNLSIRTMAVWGMKWYIVGPLVAISLGHWSLLLHSIFFITAKWVPNEGCVITSTDRELLSATIIYIMSFDFIVLVLTASKLVRPPWNPSIPKSRLVHMMFTDGLYYFIISFLAYLVATVFMIINLNPVMSVIANAPAYVASTIAASRVVRRLSNFSAANTEVFPSTGRPHASVHVQMDTLKFSEPTSHDAEGRVVKVGGLRGGLDSEAQQIGNEFKHEHYAS